MTGQEVPAFCARPDEGTIVQFALRLLKHTAERSKPLRFLRVDQIGDDVQATPAEPVIGRKRATSHFRVPISPQTMAVTEHARPSDRNGHVFPGTRKGVISDATMSRFMKRHRLHARPHGSGQAFGIGSRKPRKRHTKLPGCALVTKLAVATSVDGRMGKFCNRAPCPIVISAR